MSRTAYMILPAIILLGGIGYLFFSREVAGTVMLVFFAAAMALMGWILLPTVSDVGPVAPVDPEWHESRYDPEGPAQPLR